MKYMIAFFVFCVAFQAQSREKVVFVEAHPDDLAGHLGMALRLLEKYDVHIIDFTHGELGLGEAALRDGSCKKIRTEEETALCKASGFVLHWCDQVDGSSYACESACDQLKDYLTELKPRAIICHWPIDTHLDHAMSAVAVLKAIQKAQFSPEVYFQEQHHQSKNYRPTLYIDISMVKDRKDGLTRFYRCQDPEGIICRKTADAKAYGIEVGVKYAETLSPLAGTVSFDKSIFTGISGVMFK